jgi:hypothetical protein
MAISRPVAFWRSTVSGPARSKSGPSHPTNGQGHHQRGPIPPLLSLLSALGTLLPQPLNLPKPRGRVIPSPLWFPSNGAGSGQVHGQQRERPDTKKSPLSGGLWGGLATTLFDVGRRETSSGPDPPRRCVSNSTLYMRCLSPAASAFFVIGHDGNTMLDNLDQGHDASFQGRINRQTDNPRFWNDGCRHHSGPQFFNLAGTPQYGYQFNESRGKRKCGL